MTDAMEAFKEKLFSEQGVAVLYQKDSSHPKTGILRLKSEAPDDGPVETLVLSRCHQEGEKKKRLVEVEEDRMQLKDVVGAFGSTNSTVSDSIVLVAATRSTDNPRIQIAPWRFTIDDETITPSHDDIIKFLCGGNDSTNGVLKNFLSTERVTTADTSITFFKESFNEDGLIGSLEHFPLILQVSSDLFEVGQWAGAAAVFAVFASMVSGYETVQGLQLDLINLLARFGVVEETLVDEKTLKGDLLALAEDFFFMPTWRRHLTSKEFQGSLTRLADRMNRAVQSRTLQNTVEMDSDVETLLDWTASKVKDELFDWMIVKSMLWPKRRLFLGREAELAKVRSNLDRAGTITAVVGVAGCGKSHLAREAAYQWNLDAPDGEHRVVLFVNASSEASARASVEQIMVRLGLEQMFQEDGEAISTSELFSRIHTRIAKAPRNVNFVLILDDAPASTDGPDLLNEWLGLADDCCWSNTRVIVTSRSSAFSDETSLGTIEAIPLHPLPADVSLALLMEPFPSFREQENEKSTATELVTDFLHNLPVAILVVSGLMLHKKWTFRDYLRRLGERQVEAGADSVRNVLQDALAEARKDSRLARVLDVAAFVGRDNIPLSLLGNEELVKHLCTWNLLQVTMNEQYSMHGLIQEAAQTGRSPRDAILVLDESLQRYDDDDPDTWSAAVAMLPHVEVLRRVASVDYVLKNLLTSDVEQYIRLVFNCGKVYNTVLCQFESSQALFEDCLMAQRFIYGEMADHSSIVSTLNHLGAVCMELEDYIQSKAYLEEALALERAVHQDDSNQPSIANLLCNLGNVSKSLGEDDMAKTYYQQALAMRRVVYKETTNHASIADTLCSLGDVCKSLCDHEQAKMYYEQALAMFRTVYKETPHHTSIAMALGTLGTFYLSLREYEQSKEYFEEALAMFQSVEVPDEEGMEMAQTGLFAVDLFMGNNNE